jgi:tetratricopeptide (TPR) repeat protein
VNNKYTQLLLQNLSHIILAVLVLMLGVIYWFKSKEQSIIVEGGQAAAEAKPDPLLPDEMFSRAQEMVGSKPPIDQTEIGVVMKFDMFDAQQVQDKATREQQANTLFAQAQALDTQGKPDEALKVIEEIFKVYPPHIQAKELRNKILKESAKPVDGSVEGAAVAPTPAAVQ